MNRSSQKVEVVDGITTTTPLTKPFSTQTPPTSILYTFFT